MELLNFTAVASSTLLILAAAAAFTFFFVSSIRRKKLPPGPYGLPIIGNLVTVGDRPHESLTNLAKTYGPLMTLKFGMINIVVASSTEMAKEILQKKDQTFLGRPVPDAIRGEKGHEHTLAWISGGSHWRKLRKICYSRFFNTQRLDAFQHLRHQMMNIMVQRVDEARSKGEGVNIGRLVFGTALNSLSNTMFSLDLLDMKLDAIKELKLLMANIMELAGKPNLSDYFPFLKAFDLQGIRRQISVSYDRLHQLVGDIIDQRMKQRRSRGSDRCGDFLDVLLDYTEEQGPEALNYLDVALLLIEMLVGGTDTTTSTVEWVMAELLHNPLILSKAKQELVDKISPGDPVQEQDMPQLPYLDAVIKETMRLHTTSPLLLPHRSEEQVEIGGYTIPKHTHVIVNFWSISKDPAYWDEPTVFNPERFVELDADFRGKNFAFIPFSAGRRICPGLNLAVRMVSLIVATLVHNFEWKLPNGMMPEELDMTDKFGVTLHKAHPLVAIPL